MQVMSTLWCVEILYKCGGKLAGERTWKPLRTNITELQFADDVALVGSSRDEIERAPRILDEVTSDWGLTVSLHKTKLLVAGVWNEDDLQPITVRVQIPWLSSGGAWGGPEVC